MDRDSRTLGPELQERRPIDVGDRNQQTCQVQRLRASCKATRTDGEG
jgi:hypothetical protein